MIPIILRLSLTRRRTFLPSRSDRRCDQAVVILVWQCRHNPNSSSRWVSIR